MVIQSPGCLPSPDSQRVPPRSRHTTSSECSAPLLLLCSASCKCRAAQQPGRPRASHSGNQRPQPRMRGGANKIFLCKIKTINCTAVPLASDAQMHSCAVTRLRRSLGAAAPSLCRAGSLNLQNGRLPLATFCRHQGVGERHSCGRQRTRYLSLGGQLGKARLIY